jgi:hypothetical protein
MQRFGDRIQSPKQLYLFFKMQRFGHRSQSPKQLCLFFKMQRFGDGILSPKQLFIFQNTTFRRQNQVSETVLFIFQNATFRRQNQVSETVLFIFQNNVSETESSLRNCSVNFFKTHRLGDRIQSPKQMFIFQNATFRRQNPVSEMLFQHVLESFYRSDEHSSHHVIMVLSSTTVNTDKRVRY